MVFTAGKAPSIDTSGDIKRLTSSVVDLAKYIDTEFAQVAASENDLMQGEVLYVQPAKPRQGNLAYADGTHWNPGQGEGFYFYDAAGNWVPLFQYDFPPTPVVYVPSGSVLLFWQSAAPVGYTQVTSQNDKALRVVSGTGGVSGGTNAFSTVMAQTVTGSHALSIAEMPAHSHSYTVAAGAYTAAGGGTADAVTLSTGSTGSQGSGSGHTHSFTMSIQYIDIILASKN